MATKQTQTQPRAYSQAYLPNGNPTGPTHGSASRIVQAGSGARILCIADLRGSIRSLNQLASIAKADCIIHTGDFGFYDDASLDRIAEKTLKHVAQFSPLLSDEAKNMVARSHQQASAKEIFQRERLPLSELPDFLNGRYKLDVPVYTVWGACEDVAVLEKLRASEYQVHNLHIIDESHSTLLELGDVKLRLFGLGGALVMHKLFDNGEGKTTIAGGQGTMWTTLLQMGELIDNANRCYDPTETRVFVTHASPAREGLLNQLSVSVKADFSISAGLHFRYGSSYNECSVNPTIEHYKGKLAAARTSFYDVWDTVKHEVEPAVAENESQSRLLHQALDIISRMPYEDKPGNLVGAVDESAFKNMWNFNLADATFGWLVLDIEHGRIGTEMRAQGFNFIHRNTKGNYPIMPARQQQHDLNGARQMSSQHQQHQSNQQHLQQRQRPNVPPNAVHIASQNSAAGSYARSQPQTTQTKSTFGQPQSSPAPPTAANGAANPTNAGKFQGAGGQMPQADDARNHNTSSQVEAPKPSKAIYVPHVNAFDKEQEMLQAVFSDEDQKKIVKIDNNKNKFWVVHFKDTGEMLEVLERSPRKDTELGSLTLSAYRHRGGRGGHFSSSWTSTRGASAQNGARGGGITGANEGESGRGGVGAGSVRGRGGLSRGSRAGERGGRGNDRGGRGGRGGRGDNVVASTAVKGDSSTVAGKPEAAATGTSAKTSTPAPAQAAAAAAPAPAAPPASGSS